MIKSSETEMPPLKFCISVLYGIGLNSQDQPQEKSHKGVANDHFYGSVLSLQVDKR